MNLDNFKSQHADIMQVVTSLRAAIQSGVRENSADIAALIVKASSIIKLHLAGEDKYLYPAAEKSTDAGIKSMVRRYQDEMGGLAEAYLSFSRKWVAPAAIANDPEGFRSQANEVFKALHQRIQRENSELYPAVEKL
jgi:hemerythrin-like domain-containing protein